MTREEFTKFKLENGPSNPIFQNLYSALEEKISEQELKSATASIDQEKQLGPKVKSLQNLVNKMKGAFR